MTRRLTNDELKLLESWAEDLGQVWAHENNFIEEKEKGQAILALIAEVREIREERGRAVFDLINELS